MNGCGVRVLNGCGARVLDGCGVRGLDGCGVRVLDGSAACAHWSTASVTLRVCACSRDHCQVGLIGVGAKVKLKGRRGSFVAKKKAPAKPAADVPPVAAGVGIVSETSKQLTE